MAVNKELERQLRPPIVAQARYYIELAGLDPEKETLLLNGYGILREEVARPVNTMTDQKLFAFVLLMYGRRTEFDRFTEQFPVIFDAKMKQK